MSIGEVLLAARGQAGLTITQVSQRTRIRETIIRGIERDDFCACGADSTRAATFRAIAHVVGVDGEPLVADYDASHGTPQATPAAGVPEPSAPFRFRERRRPRRGVALLVVLVALAGLVTYHLVACGPAGGAAAAWNQAAMHKAVHRHPAAASTPGLSAGPPEVVISLTAVAEACWADLTTPGGATIFQGIVDPGTSMTWTERPAVTLRLGNPGAVTLTVDGKTRTGLGPDPVTLSPATRSQIFRVAPAPSTPARPRPGAGRGRLTGRRTRGSPRPARLGACPLSFRRSRP